MSKYFPLNHEELSSLVKKFPTPFYLYDEKAIRENIAEKLPLFIGILFVSMIPKYLYLLISKYTYDEIINSEMLLTDVYKVTFLIIAMVVTVQITEYAKKLFVDEK